MLLYMPHLDFKKLYLFVIIFILLFSNCSFAQRSIAVPYQLFYETDANSIYSIDPNGSYDLIHFNKSSVPYIKYKSGTYSILTSNSLFDTSAELAGIVTDETGTGKLVFQNGAILIDPNISGTAYVSTKIITPKVIGGTATTSDLYLQTTSGVGTTSADMHFLVGNNGATEAATILNSGAVLINETSAVSGSSPKMEVNGGINEVNGVLKENQLTNTQFGAWSNSDTNKGLAVIKFDTGSTAAPTAGLTLTGGTGSATGKLIRVLTQTGTFAGNDAVGYVVLGACTGRFQNNEVVSYTGGTVTVNYPDSVANYSYSAATISFATRTITDSASGFGSFSAGDVIEISGSASNDRMAAWVTTAAAGSLVIDTTESAFITESAGYTIVIKRKGAGDMIANGDFSVNTDPPAQWVAGNSALLTTEAAGKVGNCIMVTENGGANPVASQAFTTVIGKLYRVTAYVKAGTEATYSIRAGTTIAGTEYYTSGNLEETAGDWSTVGTGVFEATATTAYVTLVQVASAAAGTTMYFDEVSLYEIAPCATGADTIAGDKFNKSNSITHLYRIQGGAPGKQLYSILHVNIAGGSGFFGWYGSTATNAWFYPPFIGRTVTFGAWIKTNTASAGKLVIYDGTTSTDSSYHTGGGNWEWLEVTYTFPANKTAAYFYSYNAVQNALVYTNSPMLVYGNSIGSGNYAPKPNEIIYLDNDIASTAFDNKTGTSGFSDTAATTLNLEADSQGMLPKNVKAVRVRSHMGDAGSAATEVYFYAGQAIATLGAEYVNSPYGLANDTKAKVVNIIPTTSAGDINYQIEASGANTFDISAFKYIGVELR